MAVDSVRPPGRPAKLGAEQLSQLSEYIDQQSRLAIGGRLQGTDIQTYIEREFGVAYELSNVYRLLRELGFSWITSRSRHPKQDGRCRKLLKLPAGNDPNIPGHVALANVDVWFQDEARFGQQNTTTRLWPGVAFAPELFSNNNSSTSIFGAVCPATGTTGSLAQSSGKPGGDEAALALIAASNKAGSSCGGDHGRRRMAYHGNVRMTSPISA